MPECLIDQVIYVKVDTRVRKPTFKDGIVSIVATP